MAKKTSLKDAKDYIALTIGGTSKKDAALQVLGRNDPQTIRTMENSEAYQILINTMANNHKVALAAELQDIQTATLKAQSKLLEQGNQMMDEAETLDDKIKAQENQRRNLETSVVDKAEDWAGINRNKDANSSDILDGIVIS